MRKKFLECPEPKLIKNLQRILIIFFLRTSYIIGSITSICYQAQQMKGKTIIAEVFCQYLISVKYLLIFYSSLKIVCLPIPSLEIMFFFVPEIYYLGYVTHQGEKVGVIQCFRHQTLLIIHIYFVSRKKTRSLPPIVEQTRLKLDPM